MEPVTHLLTGACLARTGLNRRAAYATAAMAVAAEFPDVDTLWGLHGPVASFQHHRGITHTFVGIPVEAAVIVCLFWLVHRWRTQRALRSAATSGTPARKLTAAPVRFGLLYAFVLLALLSHLLLDFTNNYGIRPFFPFDTKWYAASITFIFDPLMFVVLLGALALPAIFRLVGSEVSSRRQPFAPRGWSAAALIVAASLWVLREVQHNYAVNLAMTQSVLDPRPTVETGAANYLQAQRVFASPDPFTPFRWWVVIDFGPLYELGEVNTRVGALYAGQQFQMKPVASPVLTAAESSALGRAYLDWSPAPYITVVRQGTEASVGRDLDTGHTAVIFRDPRFMGDIPLMRSRTPLEGIVELDAKNRVVRQTFGGKEQQ